MNYIKLAGLAGAMAWLAGCASTSHLVVNDRLGPAPNSVAPGKGEGSLAIYSARARADVDLNMAEWRWNNDFGKNEFLYEPAHSDYIIYTQGGEVFKHVRNSRDQDDDTPTLVTLPAGSYQVEAEAIDCHSDRVKVLLTVVIAPGQTTRAHLEGGWNPPVASGTELARLPCGRAIGWRAEASGYASARTGY